jgi:ribosome-binding protein aMBF1 (putative translation factor)
MTQQPVAIVDARMATQTHPGAAIKARRVDLDWSCETLGRAANGISAGTIRRIEREEVRPHPATIAHLNRALTLAERAAKRQAALNDHEPAADGPEAKERDAVARPSE